MVLSEKINSTTTTVTNTPNYNKKIERLTKVYGKVNTVKLMNNELWEGMNPGMVIESIGRPLSTIKEDSDWGLKEVWTYKNKELTFINGSLKIWADK